MKYNKLTDELMNQASIFITFIEYQSSETNHVSQ